jgi:two-component system phosphate regulon sensor histidine kinase PhoR
VRIRAPANVFLHRAQLIFILAALIPTIFMTAIGIVLLFINSAHGGAVIAGVLVLALCAASLTGYVVGTIFVTRGAYLARMQNEFLSAVSHELRTPLTSMSMFIDTLREERVTEPAEKKRCLDIIHREMGRLDGLVGKLIELSKIESGRHGFDRKRVAVSDIVDQALHAFEAIRFGTLVDLSVTVESDLHVFGDSSALAQALTNLLANALKYTPEKDKRIELSAVAEGKLVVITVADNGPGIPREEQELIFERFERGQAAQAAGTTKAGSGLGLAIVRAIMRAHKGKVELRSGPDVGGARFRILLPRREGA